MSNQCAIYKYVFNNEIIYIGKSDHSFEKRIEAHSKEKSFQPYLSKSDIYYFYCNNPAETTIYETYLINKYKPKLNTAMKYEDTCIFEIKEPEWNWFCQGKFKYKRSDEARKMDIGVFVLLDDMIEKQYIKPSEKTYSFTLPYTPEHYYALKDMNKAFWCLSPLKRGKKMIVTVQIEAVSKRIDVIADTSFIEKSFYRYYKKLIGKAIIEYC